MGILQHVVHKLVDYLNDGEHIMSREAGLAALTTELNRLGIKIVGDQVALADLERVLMPQTVTAGLEGYVKDLEAIAKSLDYEAKKRDLYDVEQAAQEVRKLASKIDDLHYKFFV